MGRRFKFRFHFHLLEILIMATSTRVPKLLDFDSLYLEGNIRSPGCEKIPAMVQSLRLEKFKDNHPLVVSEKTDGRYLVLCGNRRVLGLTKIRENDKAEFSRVLQNGKILCHVHKGLTKEEEIVLRIDHSEGEDRVKLDKWSEFQAVKQLCFCYPEDTQEAVAKKMGKFHKDDSKLAGQPNRGWAQPLCNLAALPPYVQEEYRKLVVEGKDSTLLRVADIKKLYTVFEKDFAEFPEGDSPVFAAAWDKILNPEPKAPAETENANAPKPYKPESATRQAQGAASRIVKRILLAVTNQGGDIVALDAEAAQNETDAQILADIKEYLGEDDYGQLASASQNARLDREAQEIANRTAAENDAAEEVLETA